MSSRHCLRRHAIHLALLCGLRCFAPSLRRRATQACVSRCATWALAMAQLVFQRAMQPWVRQIAHSALDSRYSRRVQVTRPGLRPNPRQSPRRVQRRGPSRCPRRSGRLGRRRFRRPRQHPRQLLCRRHSRQRRSASRFHQLHCQRHQARPRHLFQRRTLRRTPLLCRRRTPRLCQRLAQCCVLRSCARPMRQTTAQISDNALVARASSRQRHAHSTSTARAPARRTFTQHASILRQHPHQRPRLCQRRPQRQRPRRQRRLRPRPPLLPLRRRVRPRPRPTSTLARPRHRWQSTPTLFSRQMVI